MTKRVWHTGPPPHIGWWEASAMWLPGIWRWWNGSYWSMHATEDDDVAVVRSRASVESLSQDIEWTNHWPKNARVPRVDPGRVG